MQLKLEEESEGNNGIALHRENEVITTNFLPFYSLSLPPSVNPCLKIQFPF